MIKEASSQYWDKGKSINAQSAESDGRFPKTEFIKRYGIDPSKIVDPTEWHHSSKYFNKVDYYSLQDVFDALWELDPVHRTHVLKNPKFKELWNNHKRERAKHNLETKLDIKNIKSKKSNSDRIQYLKNKYGKLELKDPNTNSLLFIPKSLSDRDYKDAVDNEQLFINTLGKNWVNVKGWRKYLNNMNNIKLVESKLIVENLNTFKKKIQSEHPELTMDQIEYYIFRFNEIKNSSRFKMEVQKKYPEIKNINDVTKYTFEQLEHLIDLFADKKEKYAIDVKVDNSKSIYDENGIEIFLADSKNKCIKYRQEFENQTKQQYSFCISRGGNNNLYYSYRFNKNEPTFYFIINKQLPITDKLHVVVVHVNKTEDSYNLTNATNANEQHNLTWNDLVKNVPYLKNLQHLFKPVGLTSSEQTMKAVKFTVDETIDNLMDHFNNYEKVEAYIEYGHALTINQFNNLTDPLKMKYINKGHAFELNFLKTLSPKLLKNYQRNQLIKFKASNYNLENSKNIQNAFYNSNIPDSVFLDIYNTNKSIIPKIIGSGLLKKSIASRLFKQTFETAYKVTFDGEDLWKTTSSYVQGRWNNPVENYLDGSFWDYMDNWEPSVDDSTVDECRNNINPTNLNKIKDRIIKFRNSSDDDDDDDEFEYTEDEIRVMTLPDIVSILEEYDHLSGIEDINRNIISATLSMARVAMENAAYSIVDNSINKIPGFEYVDWDKKEIICYLTFKQIDLDPKDYADDYRNGEPIDYIIKTHLEDTKFYEFPTNKFENVSWDYEMDFDNFNEELSQGMYD